MANFFDENDIIADSSPKSSFFDEADLHSEEASRDVAGQESDKVGELHPEWNPDLRSALVGVGSGATFGLAEEVSAPFMAAAQMADAPTLPEESQLSKFQRLMQTYRDVAREEQKAAQTEHPGAYTAGAITGGIATLPLLPTIGATTTGGKIAAGAAEGTALGAAYGAGEAEGGAKERLVGAAEGGLTGLVGGAAVPAAGAIVKPITSKLTGTVSKGAQAIGEIPIIKDTVSNLKRGLKDQNLITSKGRREAAGIVRDKSGELYKDVKELQKRVGEAIGAKIDEASAAGKKVDLTQEVDSVLKELQTIKAEGSKEAAAYADALEKEINKAVKSSKETPALSDQLSGLIKPDVKRSPTIELDPKDAQSLKQVLSDFTPKKGMAPQEIAPAKQAKELSSATGEKLVTASDTGDLNKEYGLIKDTLKRLGIKETSLPTQIKAKINATVSQLEKENLTGDQARALIDDVVSNIKQIDPEIAAKYEVPLVDAVERLSLANKNLGGQQVKGLAANVRGAITSGANAVGLVAGKAGANPVLKAAGQVSNFTKTMLKKVTNDDVITRGGTTGMIEGSSAKAAVSQAELQRRVAKAAESADPETLRDQANQIRQKYGTKGEKLATMLTNLAEKDKSGRRALMFAILGDPAHKDMLGLLDKEE